MGRYAAAAGLTTIGVAACGGGSGSPSVAATKGSVAATKGATQPALLSAADLPGGWSRTPRAAVDEGRSKTCIPGIFISSNQLRAQSFAGNRGHVEVDEVLAPLTPAWKGVIDAAPTTWADSGCRSWSLVSHLWRGTVPGSIAPLGLPKIAAGGAAAVFKPDSSSHWTVTVVVFETGQTAGQIRVYSPAGQASTRLVTTIARRAAAKAA